MSKTISPNSAIAQYTILSKIGEGGMGEVWRARDPKLGRDVAVKVLPAALSADKDRLARFEQEAQAAGALNHPNILVIFHLGIHNGAPYIVSELLEGESLRDTLDQRALTSRKATEYAIQLAHGLTAAHERGVVHRDLKPDNIFITKDDRVKILDFGLAKLVQPSGTITSQTDIATRKVHTHPGTVMGTVGYMSPEQVRGDPADHRSDIFSFGSILFEMLSGQRAFRRDTTAETMTAILKEEPPEFSLTNSNISSSLEKIVRRCLEKQPARRFQTASDLGFALEALSTSSGPSQATSAFQPAETSPPTAFGFAKRERLAWIAAAVLLLVSLASLPFVIGYFRRSSPIEPGTLKLSVAAPDKTSLRSLAISPDGRWLAFTGATAGKEQLWIRALDSLAAQALPGTEGAGYPFWSPDSHWIAFSAGGKLKKIASSGGAVQTICDAGITTGGAWNRDGVILFTTLGFGLYRVSPTGTDLKLLRTQDPANREWNFNAPSFLPDQRHFLYYIQSSNPQVGGLYVGSLDDPIKQRLLAVNTKAVYAPSSRGDVGYLVYMREGALLAQPFDAQQLKFTGDAIPLAEHVSADSSFFAGNFSVSNNGTLVYDGSVDRESKQLVLVDRDGKQITWLGRIGGWSRPALSPDEKRVAVDRADKDTATRDLWVYDVNGGNGSRFTFDPADDSMPVWSPDGASIVWGSNRGSTFDLYQKAANGAGQDEVIFSSDYIKVATDWSRDSRYIIFYQVTPKSKRDLWILPLFGDRKPIPFLQTEANEAAGKLSPDGQWLVYASDESGGFETYVQSFPSGGGKRQISIHGGLGPSWRGDGKELYYYTPDGALMAVDVIVGSSLSIGVPHRLFDFRSGNGLITVAPYSASADGKRFLLNTLVDESGGAPLTIVLNWTADLKR
ncbi:MAG: protein kinase domain-containing protein [Acidobacteriota bacterium]